jgi:hypothetical protein
MTPAGPGGRARRSLLAGAALLALCLPAWWIDRTALLAAWLAAWLFCLGIALGGLVNVWIHNLTGGAWGEAVREPLLRLGGLLPWLAVLFIPVLARLPDLYPWAAADPAGDWGRELAVPSFKQAWLEPRAFLLRAVGLLVLWNLLAWASRWPTLRRSRRFSAAALIVYAFSASVAAADWIMSLMPLWYSSVFGLVVCLDQVVAGMAFATVAVCLRRDAVEPWVRGDLGSLLFGYVLIWGYLAFMQYLIIWAEDLPHEVLWYLARRSPAWLTLGWALAACYFAAPLLLLLFRPIKRSARWLGAVAALLLVAHLLDLWWLVLPSVAGRLDAWHLAWLLPSSALGLAALCHGLLIMDAGEGARGEVRHA